MLRPSKHSHPDQTVINVAAKILERLREQRSEEYSALLQRLKKRVDGAEVLFLPALALLFLLGLVAYRPKTDSFEYVGRP